MTADIAGFVAAISVVVSAVPTITGLLILRQNRRLISSQANKADAEASASIVQQTLAYATALDHERKDCRERLDAADIKLAELSKQQGVNIEELRRANHERAEISIRLERVQFEHDTLARVLQEAGAAAAKTVKT